MRLSPLLEPPCRASVALTSFLERNGYRNLRRFAGSPEEERADIRRKGGWWTLRATIPGLSRLADALPGHPLRCRPALRVARTPVLVSVAGA
jgi:hypothetical protein